jgi:hypothetical protein
MANDSRKLFQTMKPVRPWNTHRVPIGVRPIERTWIGTTRPARALKRPVFAFSRLNAASIAADLLALAVGLVSSFTVHIVGDLPVSEVLILCLLPVFLIMQGKRVLRPGLPLIYSLLGLWLANQVMTDFYRGTATLDWLRGDAAIIFFVVDLAFLAMLVAKNERRKLIFLAAYAAGSLFTARFFPTEYMQGDPWKLTYATGTNIMVVLASCYCFSRRNYVVVLILLAGIAGVNLLFDFRSPVLLLFITAVLAVPVIPDRIGRLRVLPAAGSGIRVVVLVLMALAASLSALGLVNLMSSAGMLGADAQQKNEMQSRAKGGLLIGGRPEILVSSRAVWDSPLLGHGSWAKDYKYVEMLDDILSEYGIATNLEYAEESFQGLIPSHSHLMGAWVWAGIFGAVFWVYIFWLTLKGVIRVATLRPPLAPIYMYILVGFLWDILFSPFGSTRRITEALSVVIILDLLGTGDYRFGMMQRLRRPQWKRLALRERLTASRQNVGLWIPGRLPSRPADSPNP